MLSQQINSTAPAAYSFLQKYSYDPLKRIQSITDSAGAAITTPTPLQRSFSYDAYGNNWMSRNDSGLPYNVLTPTAASNFAGNNRLTSTTAGYDFNGNQTTNGSYLYNYDAENRLIEAEDTVAPVGFLAFAYDGLGQRVQKQSSTGTVTTYVFDAFGQLAAEYSNVPVASSCTTCYLSWDHLGSTRLVTDDGGNVVSRHDFMPFGEEITGMGRDGSWGLTTDAVTQKFTGQQRDEGQGADFFNARYMYSAIARFMSPDPLSAGADLYNPQSWNGYAYVGNDPLGNVDPDGLDTITAGTSAMPVGSGGTATGTQQGSGAGSGLGFTFGGSYGPISSGRRTPSFQLGPWLADVGKSVYNGFADLGEDLLNIPDPDVPIPNGPHIFVPKGTVTSKSADRVGMVLSMVIPGGGEEVAAVRGFRGLRAINLPAWEKVSVALGHIAERHMTGGRLTEGRNVFLNLNREGVLAAVRQAYQSATVLSVQGAERLQLVGKTKTGMTVEIWFNRVLNKIETAYPKGKQW